MRVSAHVFYGFYGEERCNLQKGAIILEPGLATTAFGLLGLAGF